MLGSIYMVVLDYMRKAGCDAIDSLKEKRKMEKERERTDSAYKEIIRSNDERHNNSRV